jgi:uncharacterized protein
MKRSLLNTLVDWKNQAQRKPLLLEGARQVGKTWLLEHFGENNFSNVLLLDFAQNPELSKLFDQNLEPSRILGELEFFANRRIDIDSTLLIFDEIQICPNALTSLKYFYKAYPTAYICASGSLLGLGLGATNFPVGKVQRAILYPMSFLEFIEACGEKLLVNAIQNIDLNQKDGTIGPLLHEKAFDLFKQYLNIGGLPEVVATFIEHRRSLFQAYQKVRTLQKELLRSYMDDIAKHAGNLKAIRISSLFNNIPEQLAKEKVSSKFVFKGVLSSQSNYANLEGPLEWLNRAGLVHRVPICHKARIPLMSYTKENTFILYLFDVGILGAMLDLSPTTLHQYDFGQQKGFLAENFVLQELLCSGQDSIFSWAENTSEIEFLIIHNDHLLPIEVKAGLNLKAKSLKVFKEKYQPPASLLLSARDYLSHHDGHVQLPIYTCSQIGKLFLDLLSPV